MKNPSSWVAGAVALATLVSLGAETAASLAEKLPPRTMFFDVAKRTPSVDGVVHPGEYAAGIPWFYRITNFSQRKLNYLSAKAQQAFFAWDDARLFFAFVSEVKTVRAKEKAHDGKVYEDDCVEFYIAGTGKGAPRYHLIVNTLGVVCDECGGDKSWTADGVDVKSVVKDGVWTLEVSVPWASMPKLAFREGRELFLNIARSYLKGPSGMGFDPTYVEGLPVFLEYASLARGGYGDTDSYPLARFRSQAAWFDLAPCGDLTTGTLKGIARVRPGVSGQQSVALVSSGDGPHFNAAQVRTVTAGEEQAYEFAGACPKSGVVWTIFRDAAGHEFFKSSNAFRAPIPFVYRGLRTDPETQTLYILSDNWIPAGERYTIDVSFRDFATDSNVVHAVTVPAADVCAFGAEQAVDVKPLPPGLYTLRYTVKRPDGSVFVTDKWYYGKPASKGGDWSATRAGDYDWVPPPWNAPEFRADGFSVWQRAYRFGGDGLVSSATSLDKELLKGAVELVLDGKRVSFEPKLVAKRTSTADYRLVAKNAPCPLVVDAHVEFDGFILFSLSYGPGAIGSLQLKFPLDRAEVAGHDDCSSAVRKLVLPKGTNGTWTYDPADKPFFWTGNGTRGLMGGIDSLRGWHLKDRARGYVLKVDDATCEMTFNLVDTPVTAEKKRTLQFYLQATPVKPKNGALAALPRQEIMSWATGYLRFFEAREPAFIVEGGLKRLTDEIDRGRRVFYYGGSHGSSTVMPWWGWFGDDWNFRGNPIEYAPYAESGDRTQVDMYRWNCSCLNARNFLDYKIWSQCWMINEPRFKVKDLYFDLAYPYHCQNAKHGCVWTDEFGKVAKDWDMLATREFHKRVYAELKRKDPEGAVMAHLDATRTPADSFFDWLLMGETFCNQVRQTGTYHEVFTPEQMQVAYAARSSEAVVEIIPQLYRTLQLYSPERAKKYDPTAPAEDAAIKHALAYALVHDLRMGGGPRPRDPKSGRLADDQWDVPQAYLESLGADRRFGAYYQEGCPLSVDDAGPRFLYGAYVGAGGKGLLVFLNDTDEAVVRRVRFDAKGFGMSSSKFRELFTAAAVDFISGEAMLSLAPRAALFLKTEE